MIKQQYLDLYLEKTKAVNYNDKNPLEPSGTSCPPQLDLSDLARSVKVTGYDHKDLK